MINRSLILLALLLGVSYMATADELVVFNNQAVLPQNVVFGDWGNFPHEDGDAAFRPKRIENNCWGLKITTVGRYQGARFDFKKALDTSKYFGANNSYLELYIRATRDDVKTTKYPGYPPGWEPGMNLPTPDWKPGMPIPPGYVPTWPPGAGPGGPGLPPGIPGLPPGVPGLPPGVPDFPGMPPGWVPGMPIPPGYNPGGNQPTLPPEFLPDPPKEQSVSVPDLKNLRFTFFTDKGQGQLIVSREQFEPMEDDSRHQWVKIDIPLSLINSKLPVNGGKMTRMLITSDEPAEFYLGRLAFVQDSTPFQVNLFTYPNVFQVGTRVYFRARVNPGMAKYEVLWDFDAMAGDTVDAKGDRVTFTFPKEGSFKVTCKVKDLGNGKETVTKELVIKVANPEE